MLSLTGADDELASLSLGFVEESVLAALVLLIAVEDDDAELLSECGEVGAVEVEADDDVTVLVLVAKEPALVPEAEPLDGVLVTVVVVCV